MTTSIWTPPRFGTDRDRSARTHGPLVARAAYGLGWSLNPMQRHVADVASELRDDGTRPSRYRYRTVVLVVPRRAGKTVLSLAAQVQRAQRLPRRRGWITAQDRESAAALWREDWAPALGALPGVRLRVANGSESIRFLRTGSTIALFAPGPKALHSKDADTVTLDEAWAHTRERGAQLLQAVRPAQGRDGRTPQTWIVSAGGTHESTWLLDWMDRGRGGDPDVAYFEWSADPDDDLEDPAVWQRVHPGGIPVEEMRGALKDMGVEEFARAYLGVFTGLAGDDLTRPVPPAAWAALATTDLVHGPRRWLGLDVSPDRTRAALAGASRLRDGTVSVVLLWAGPADELHAQALDARHPTDGRLAGVRCAPSQSDTAARLLAAGVPAGTVTGAEYVAACQRFADLVVVDRRLRHDGHPAVLDALSAAQRAWRGDAWIWSAKNSDDDVTPLVAVTLAAAAADDDPGGSMLRVRRRAA